MSVRKDLQGLDLSGDLEEGSRKRGFPLDWVLSGREGGKSMTVSSLSYLEDWRSEAGQSCDWKRSRSLSY